MALTKLLFDMLVDDELDSIMKEQDWNSVRKYIAADYSRETDEELRQRYEERFKPAYITLVNELLASGCSISVYDGEEWAARRSTDKTDILEAVEAVEVAELVIFNDGVKVGWAQVSPYGVEPDEVVLDNTLSLEQYAASLKFNSAEG